MIKIVTIMFALLAAATGAPSCDAQSECQLKQKCMKLSAGYGKDGYGLCTKSAPHMTATKPEFVGVPKIQRSDRERR